MKLTLEQHYTMAQRLNLSFGFIAFTFALCDEWGLWWVAMLMAVINGYSFKITCDEYVERADYAKYAPQQD